MIEKILVIMTIVSCVTENAQGSPHRHYEEDQYEPIIRLLKEARKQHRRGQSAGNYNPSASQQYPQLQFPNFGSGGSGSGGNNGGNSGGSSGGDTTSTPILTPGNNRRPVNIGGSIPGILPNGGSSSNYPPILPNFPSGSQVAGQLGVLPPYPIEKVNQGVSTILGGVRSLDLGQILRGAFVFPRNENVRSVANTVIDSIFGSVKSTPRRK